MRGDERCAAETVMAGTARAAVVRDDGRRSGRRARGRSAPYATGTRRAIGLTEKSDETRRIAVFRDNWSQRAGSLKSLVGVCCPAIRVEPRRAGPFRPGRRRRDASGNCAGGVHASDAAVFRRVLLWHAGGVPHCNRRLEGPQRLSRACGSTAGADAMPRALRRLPRCASAPYPACRPPNACLIRANSPCCVIHSAYAR